LSIADVLGSDFGGFLGRLSWETNLDDQSLPGILNFVQWEQCAAMERNPDKASGAWVFRGTRVPVSALFENLDAGATVDEFLEWFPGVTKQQVDEVLSFTSQSLATA